MLSFRSRTLRYESQAALPYQVTGYDLSYCPSTGKATRYAPV
jgi:hypothetical protein